MPEYKNMKQHPRLTRENRTVELMIQLYCRKQHAHTTLCPDCRELQEYARLKLEKVPFPGEKAHLRQVQSSLL